MPLQFTTYAEQHYDELLTLFEIVDSIETPILMGDFNHGPAIPRENVVYIFPFHYGLMNARGFVSPYVLLDGRCTLCTENPAVLAMVNQTIDHVYILSESFEGRVVSSEVSSYLPLCNILSDKVGCAAFP